jgi:hypothetical protein
VPFYGIFYKYNKKGRGTKDEGQARKIPLGIK